MAGSTPKTGAGSPCEAGPGASPPAERPAPFPVSIFGLCAAIGVANQHAAPRGLALRLKGDEADTFEIALLGETGAPLMVLGPFPEDDAIAIWRSLGASSGLPLMIQDPEGGLQNPYPQIGPLQLGPIRIRRGHGLLSGRRPRFLVRRKTGALPRRPRVHRGRPMTGETGT
jgi:hypothetical protein